MNSNACINSSQGAEFFYSTDNYTVARVDGSGKITAISEGTANISAYVKMGEYWVGSSTKISVTEGKENK